MFFVLFLKDWGDGLHRTATALLSCICKIYSYALTCIPIILLSWYVSICCCNPELFYVAKCTNFFGPVQAKTLPLVIVLFTVVIVFILCARKSRHVSFAFGKEKKTLICHLYYCFSGLHPTNYFSRKNC